MLKFIGFFLLVYTIFHMAFYMQAKVLLPDTRWWRWGLMLWLVLMMMAPILCRILDRNGYEASARILGDIGYNWMGFIFLAFCGVMLVYGLEFVRLCITLLTPLSIPSLLNRGPIGMMILSVIGLVIYGSFEARSIRIERIRILSEKLPSEIPLFSIVQISDLHLGLFVRGRQLHHVMEIIQSLSPDMLVATGDIVDGSGDHLMEMAEVLKQIRPKFGKYAITGNHEFYVGIDQSVNFYQQAGFTLLRDQTVAVDSWMTIAGMDDSYKPRLITPLLASIPNKPFVLLLNHRPLIDKQSLGVFDLQLSGHTHNGQIFPFSYVVARQFPYIAGLYELENGSKLYVSRGTGTWGPQIRILAPPEITVIEIRHPS